MNSNEIIITLRRCADHACYCCTEYGKWLVSLFFTWQNSIPHKRRSRNEAERRWQGVMANRVCEKCICYDVCLLHEDNFIDDVAKNGFCGKFKNKADFVEVKHGYWKHTVEKGTTFNHHFFTCSLCGASAFTSGYEKYCHNCGAKNR